MLFRSFFNFSDWLWQATGKTHQFAHEKLTDLVHDHLVDVRGCNRESVKAVLLADYTASGARGRPLCLAVNFGAQVVEGKTLKTPRQLAQRQARHAPSKLEA